MTARSLLPIMSFATLVSCGGGDGGTGPNVSGVVTDPAQAVFVTSDIPRFWAAFDAGGGNGSTAPFQAEYLDRASQGLRDFIGLRSLTAASLAQMVRTY